MKKGILFLIVLGITLIQQKTFAQVVIDTSEIEDVNICFDTSKVFVQFSFGNGNTGSYIDIKLPFGFNFLGLDSFYRKNSGSVQYIGVINGKHRIDLGGNTTADSLILYFKQFANCNAGLGSFTFIDTFEVYNGINLEIKDIKAANGYTPALSINNIVSFPSSANVGDTIQKIFNVINGGFGPAKQVLVSAKFPINELLYISNSIEIDTGGGMIVLSPSKMYFSADSFTLLIDDEILKYIGNKNNFLENGEYFKISFKAIPISCGKGNVITNSLYATFICNNGTISYCDIQKQFAGTSILVAGAPNLVYSKFTRKYNCFNGDVLTDTLMVRNTGLGAATKLNFDLWVNGYPVIPRQDMYGYLDTAIIGYRIGKNGTFIKPILTVISNSTLNNSIGGNISGKPVRATCQIPFLAPGDTLFLYTGTINCTINYSCATQQTWLNQIGYPGTGFNATYENACGNNNYFEPNQAIRAYIYPINQGSNLSPTSFSTGNKYTLRVKFDRLNAGWDLDGKKYFDVKINLPSVFDFDNTITNYIYFVYNGIKYFPYSSPSNGVFRFNKKVPENLVDLFVHIDVPCNTISCSGIVNWGFGVDVNPDSVSCGLANTWVCQTYPVSYFNNCKACCPAGLIMTAYASDRVNFGKPDNNNNMLEDASGAIDTSKVRTEMIISGDTVQFLFKGYFKTDATHVDWKYANVNFNLPNRNAYFTHVNSTLIIRRNGIDTLINITPTFSGNDIRNNISNYGTYYNNDSIIVLCNFRYKGNAETSFTTKPSHWAAHINNATGSNAYGCGVAVDYITSWRSSLFLDMVRSEESAGCRNFVIHNSLYGAVGGYGYANINRFEYEYRPIGYPTEVKQVIPNGYIVDSILVINLAHSGQTINPPYPIKKRPFYYSGDTLIYSLASLFSPNGGPYAPSDEGYTDLVYIYLHTTCEIQEGAYQTVKSSANYYRYQDEFAISYIDNNTMNTQTSLYYTKPKFITASTNAILPTISDTFTWEILHTNNSTIIANNSWLYFYQANQTISIDSIKVNNNWIQKDAKGFFRLGNIIGNQQLNIKVPGKSSSCGLDSVIMYQGYGCDGYPIQFSLDICSPSKSNLYILPQMAGVQTQLSSLENTPIDPSLQLSAKYGANTVNMCENIPFEVKIQSTKSAPIFNLKQIMRLPMFYGQSGLDYILDSGFIEYPIGTTPRKFNEIGEQHILNSMASGFLTIDFSLIDSSNFKNQGLD